MKHVTLSGKSTVVSEEEYLRNIQLFMETYKNFPIEAPRLTHTFANGIYIREIFLRANTLSIGAIHKKETVNILSKGSVKILMENGVKVHKASSVFVTPPYTQKVALALEDSVFINIMHTDKRSVEEIEDEWVIGGSKILFGNDNEEHKKMRLKNEKIKFISS
jgi:hypothetical protein